MRCLRTFNRNDDGVGDRAPFNLAHSREEQTVSNESRKFKVPLLRFEWEISKPRVRDLADLKSGRNVRGCAWGAAPPPHTQ